ncbi:roadblock/LC7 domain-containing protein [Actinomadura atramentaria]|uniref:roadblock/LC7 domain-containing protein n=1 Tax=Actinomadura atramentaria TaxID=1990 RepID=UPI00037786E2|nr:roadblock/LC7 domain-containing protein [Actinomadura atramentaria]
MATPPTAPDVRAVLAELALLRGRLPGLVGSLVASADGLLVAHDLPPDLEPHGLAALTASQLGLSHRLAAAGGGGAFHEVVVRGDGGHVVVYSAGRTASLTVLAGPATNVGRLHLESRPVARAIAGHLAAPRGRVHHPERKDAP